MIVQLPSFELLVVQLSERKIFEETAAYEEDGESVGGWEHMCLYISECLHSLELSLGAHGARARIIRIDLVTV